MKSIRQVYKIGRGPSSSHTMGPERAARRFAALCPEADGFKAVLYGSLGKTGKGHKTDEAITLGFAPLPVELIFDTETQDLPHQNTMLFIAYAGEKELLRKRYLSIGGGDILPRRNLGCDAALRAGGAEQDRRSAGGAARRAPRAAAV